MINASLVMEIFLAVLLLACLAYCWRVERSLSQFRASRAQMDSTARELILAVTKAEGAIKNLRLASHEAGEQLQGRINDARALADELAVMGGVASQRLTRADLRSEPRALAPPRSPAAIGQTSQTPQEPMWNR